MSGLSSIGENITHQVRLHLVNDSSQGSSSPLSSVTGPAAIGLEDQLLVHKEVHLPSSPSLQVFLNELTDDAFTSSCEDCSNDLQLVARRNDAVNHNNYVSSSVCSYDHW